MSIDTIHHRHPVSHEPRATTHELLLFPNTGFEAKSAVTHAPLPSRVETNTLRARSALDPVSQWKLEPAYGELNASLDRGNLEQLLHQQQQMIGLQQKTFQSMASTIKQFSLPKPEISKCDGNLLDYWNFVLRSFENSIARSASDDSERLSYLLQFWN